MHAVIASHACWSLDCSCPSQILPLIAFLGAHADGAQRLVPWWPPEGPGLLQAFQHLSFHAQDVMLSTYD